MSLVTKLPIRTNGAKVFATPSSIVCNTATHSFESPCVSFISQLSGAILLVVNLWKLSSASTNALAMRLSSW